MRTPLVFLVLLYVFAEIAGFILVGQAIGVVATLALTLLSMVVGVALLRWQSVATLTRIRADLAARRAPARPLLDGAMLALAALLMIVPGFLTDAAGILLFIPAIRGSIWRRLSRRFKVGAAANDAPYLVGGAVVELDRESYVLKSGTDTPWRRNGEQA